MLTLSNIKEKVDEMGTYEVLYKKWDIRYRNQNFIDLYWLYFPSTDKYFFEGNPSFLYEYLHLDDMARYPVIMVRDGYIGLVDFFIANPKPKPDFRTTLIINKKYANLVPKAWENQVCLYSIHARAENTKKNKKLIVHGFGVAENFLKKSPEEVVLKIKEVSKGYDDVIFLTPGKYSVLKEKEPHEKSLDFIFLTNLFKHFGHEIQIEDDPNKYISLLKEPYFDFYNLDEDHVFMSDNYVDHALYAKGGQSLNSSLDTSDSKVEYNLSMYHKVALEEFKFSKDQSIFSKLFVDYKMSGMPLECSIFRVLYSEELVDHFVTNF